MIARLHHWWLRLCGDTLSGIYARYNPAAVPYPTEDPT